MLFHARFLVSQDFQDLRIIYNLEDYEREYQPGNIKLDSEYVSGFDGWEKW